MTSFLFSPGACVVCLLATCASRLTTPVHRGWLSQWPCTSSGRCCRKPLPGPRLGGWLSAAVTPGRFPRPPLSWGGGRGGQGLPSRCSLRGCYAQGAQRPPQLRAALEAAERPPTPPGSLVPLLPRSRSSRGSSGAACEARRRQDEDDGGFRGVSEGLAPLQVTAASPSASRSRLSRRRDVRAGLGERPLTPGSLIDPGSSC